MPPLLEDLIALLRSLPRLRRPELAPDLAACRAVFWEELQSLESAREIRAQWLEDLQLEHFCTLLAPLLCERFAIRAQGRLQECLIVALRRQLHRRSGMWDATDDLADDLADRAWGEAWALPYAQRVGLLREDADTWELQPAGSLLLRLVPLDALRWLLALEVAQQGLPGFVTPALAQHLLNRSGRRSWETAEVLDRLVELCLVSISGSVGTGEDTLTLSPAGVTLLREVASGAETPLSILASAALHDGRAQTLATLGPSGGGPPSTAEELVRQAKLVVHELGNALAPTRAALEGLFAALGDRGVPSAELTPYRQRIDAGLDRVHRFSKEFLATANLSGAEARERLDVSACLRDAIAGLNGAAACVALEAAAPLPSLLGKRTSFVLALRELLRNALRATEVRDVPRVTVTAQVSGRHLLLRVDDNGPGVVALERDAIFTDGFSSRREGGFGLGQVRSVVQGLGGQVECQESPFGGARFVLTLPLGPGG